MRLLLAGWTALALAACKPGAPEPPPAASARPKPTAATPATPVTATSAPPESPTQAEVGQKMGLGANGAEKYFTNVVLVNQDGKPMRFYADLISGKTVIINVFFSTCGASCPVLSQALAKIQEHLGPRVGKDVHMVSISVDPLHDTPEQLKKYAERFKAKPGWYFMTGPKENVDLVLHKIGQFVEDPNDHSAVVIVGNEPTGLWKKAFGLARTDELIKVIDSVVDDRGDSNSR